MTPQITIDDETFKRTWLKVLIAFYVVVGGLLLWQSASYALKWHEWSFMTSGGVFWLLMVQQLSNFYFNRDQQRDHDLGQSTRAVTLRRSRLEIVIEIGWVCAMLAWLISLSYHTPKLEDEPLASTLFIPLLALALSIFCLPIVMRDIRHLVTGERQMQLTPQGLGLPEFHDGLIAWSDIKALHVGQRVLITLYAPALKPKRRIWWQVWPNFGTWSEDKTVLRLYATQFNAGAREIAVALSARLKAFGDDSDRVTDAG